MGTETAQVRISGWRGVFLFVFFLCLCMCGNDEGFVHFLYLVAKTPPAFQK